ncbi:MAG: preprotein translocase subunit YajC [Saprospiraceae bacterium]
MMTNLFLQFGGGGANNLFFLAAMLAIFVFMIFLPQRKKSKEQKTFMSDLEKGQEVVTASGILGRINKIDDSIITLDIGTGGSKNFVRVTKNAISKELTDAIFPATKNEDTK